ncbi:ribonuclease domain-containing protein [Streptomyces sp. NPDC048266]|uniref:ribonuclease domain-containing protein n=1 Tax=unclassified Streptomyces TaxID=2593676 RepID=UPI0033F68F87
MRIPPRFTLAGGVATALLSSLLLGAPATAVSPPAPAGPMSALAARAAAVGDICSSDLPSQAHDTLRLIDEGGPFPYRQDGDVFRNRERILPDRAQGYYHEYTVRTPGEPTRGARRIVTGNAAEDYYTADHYASFDLIDHGC